MAGTSVTFLCCHLETCLGFIWNEIAYIIWILYADCSLWPQASTCQPLTREEGSLIVIVRAVAVTASSCLMKTQSNVLPTSISHSWGSLVSWFSWYYVDTPQDPLGSCIYYMSLRCHSSVVEYTALSVIILLICISAVNDSLRTWKLELLHNIIIFQWEVLGKSSHWLY